MPDVDQFGIPAFEEVEAALAAQVPRRWGLLTSRGFSLTVEPDQGALWLLCPRIGPAVPANSLSTVISIRSITISGKSYIQVGASSQPLLREIYYFICGIISRAERSGEELADAIEGEISAWEMLLLAPPSLDRSQQVGLLGELWILWRLMNNAGPTAIDLWTGPQSEQHDFRLTAADIEVKTTLSHSREHTISGLGQLTTTDGRSLAVISIQIKPAGGGPGVSIAEAVDRIMTRLALDVAAVKKFTDCLTALGYRQADRNLYPARFCLRSSPMVIDVDQLFPRLTADVILGSLQDSAASRIRKVIYSVNLDGMGQQIDHSPTMKGLEATEGGDLYA